MPTRFERWMRSKLWATTALTPSSFVPLAAQSRDEPVPYSWPAIMTSGVPSLLVLDRGSDMESFSPSGWRCVVTPPSSPPSMRFLMRTLANVPRVMTRSLPRRDP